jgi:flagellar biosynthesis protein FlhF
MKIKRFIAPDMRTAFRMVREEHGADAVILSNRQTAEGVEIVAASNYDEALVQRALASVRVEPQATPNPATVVAAENPPPAAARPRSSNTASKMIAALTRRQATATAVEKPAAVATPSPTAAVAARAHTAAQLPEQIFAPFDDIAPALEPDFSKAAQALAAAPAAPPEPVAPEPIAPPPVVAVNSPHGEAELARLRDEMAQMRQMIERQMSRLGEERLRRAPAPAQALELMEDYGFDAGLSHDVATQIPADTELARSRSLMLGLLAKRLPIAAHDPLDHGGVIALIGPTGAGKTTTIAKLAARFAARHAARDVALVTTDTQRIGGREQLHSYGRQLGITVHEANSDLGLIDLLERLDDYPLVLIDTAGMGQRDRALSAQLNWLRAARKVNSLLVLPANAHFADLDEVVRRFASARPQGTVLTKLDETGRFGSALSVVVDHQLPITWVTDGQHVPNDLHRANAANLVLRLEDLRRAADKPSTPEPNHAVA